MGVVNIWLTTANLFMATRRKIMSRGLGILCAALLVLVGCGAVGGGNNPGGSSMYAGHAQGVYSGTTSNGFFFQSIVLPNDKFYEIYGTLNGNLYSASGMVAGQGASGNGTYNANVTDYQYTGQTMLDTVTASVVPDTSIGGTLIPNGSISGVAFTGTSLPLSSFSYDAPASVGNISGSWTGTQLDGTSTTLTIDSSTGAIKGTASGCAFTGTATPDSSNKNFYDVSLTFGGAPCVLLNQKISGVAVSSLLPDGVTRQMWIAGTQSASTGTVFLLQQSASAHAATDAFNGRYAFSLAGFDAAGNPMSIAGSMTADGLGHITAGEVDVNDNGEASTNNTLSGIYTFDSNIPPVGGYVFNTNSQDTLGTISLTYTVGTTSHPLAFGFAMQSSGAIAQVMSLDTNNFVASGKMRLQSATAVTLSSLAGDYAVALNGRNANNSTSVLGHITLGSSGGSSNAVFDRSIAGVGSVGPTTGAAASMVFGSAGPDANGRGTFTLTLNDGLGNASQQFAYYAIASNRILAIETDSNGTMLGELSGQSTPFTTSTVVTAGSVFGLTGVDTAATGNEIAAVGQLQMTGAGTNTATVRWDSNDAGVIVGPALYGGQAVSGFDPITGRGTVTVAAGAVNGLADSMVFYLTAPGTGYLMDTTGGVFNRAMWGSLTAQTGGPYSTLADLQGLGIVRGRGVSSNSAQALVGMFGVTTSPSTYALAFDQRYPKNGSVQTQTDQSNANIAVQSVDVAIGRGTFTLPSSGKTATEAFYIIGPNQFVFIDVSPVSSGVNGPSGLFVVDAH